jgi:hypothetical protein
MASKTVQESVSDFLSQHCIMDSLPENTKLVVLNHELTLAQVIDAMICDQRKYAAIIWNSEVREFTTIVTLRNILEFLVNICDNLQSTSEEIENLSANNSMVNSNSGHSHHSPDNLSQGGPAEDVAAREKRFIEQFLENFKFRNE